MTYDPDEAYNARMFSDEARAERKADCDRQAAREAQRHADEMAQEAAYKASNPWPIDTSAGGAMGLYELITERGD